MLTYTLHDSSHCFHDTIVVGLPLLSRSKCFSDRESDGEIRWIWLESTSVAAKLLVQYSRSYLSERSVFCICHCPLRCTISEKLNETDVQTKYGDHIYIYIYIYMGTAELRCPEEESGSLLISLSAYLAHFLYRNRSGPRQYPSKRHKTESSHRNNDEYFMTALQYLTKVRAIKT
jgi:hypothetical protein